MEPPSGYRVSSQSAHGAAPFTVVSFHTDDAFYQEHAKHFIAALPDEYPRCILERSRDRDWRGCTMYKPEVLRWAHEALDGPIVWIDIDARVRKPLEAFEDFDGDLGIAECVPTEQRLRRGKYMSGTMYLGQQDGVRRFLDRWKENAICALRQDRRFRACYGDQDLLADLVPLAKREGVRVVKLPQEYVYIFDLDQKFWPIEEGVIVHYQASRQRGRKPGTWSVFP